MPRVYDPLLHTHERDRERVGRDTPWNTDPWDNPGEVKRISSDRLRKNRRWIGWILGLAVVVGMGGIIAGGAYGYWFIQQVNPSGEPGTAVGFEVLDGDTVDSLAVRLKNTGFVTDEAVFRTYVARRGGLEIVPGFYQLKPNDSMGNIVRRLRVAPAATFTKVVFPEGFSLRQMGTRINKTMPKLSKDVFLAATADGVITSTLLPQGQKGLEGLLFPAQYEVSNSETEADVIRRMVRQMERVARQEGVVENAGKFFATPYQIMIVASIIEREAKTEEDRFLISSVIWNRMEIGMPLQVDATLYYNQDPETPFAQLKAIDSPYNTYLYTGLPPTPIASPGRASIKAALNPANPPLPADPRCDHVRPGEPCKLLFYVLKDENSHVFAVTGAQHEANVAKARAAGLLD
jgi:UPF0755 protein